MRFWQMIDQGLAEIRQARSDYLAAFPQNLSSFRLQLHRGSDGSCAFSSMPRSLRKRFYSSDVVKPILAFALRVIQ